MRRHESLKRKRINRQNLISAADDNRLKNIFENEAELEIRSRMGSPSPLSDEITTGYSCRGKIVFKDYRMGDQS